jgi:hypothetical protein
MEESVPDNQLSVSLWWMVLQAQGPVAWVMAGAVALLIIAMAWRLVRS